MPLNEILAPAYMKVFYNTEVWTHVLRLYFDGLWQPDGSGDPGEYVLNPTGAGSNVSPKDIVDRLFTNMASVLNNTTVIEKIELWHSASGANVFVAEQVPPEDGFGSGTGVASAYQMLVFKSADRHQFRITFFETNDAKPQRTPGYVPPLVDNNTVEWYMLRSGVPFVTNDNLPLTTYASLNNGYNRKLARSYGRQFVP